MRFGKRLEAKKHPKFAQAYLEYKYLKKLLKEMAEAKATDGSSPVAAVTSVVASRSHPQVQGADADTIVSERTFVKLLEKELDKVDHFTSNKVDELKSRVSILSRNCLRARQADVAGLEAEADDICEQLIELDHYIQLNGLGFEKIVKKHDKMLGLNMRPYFLVSARRRAPVTAPTRRRLASQTSRSSPCAWTASSSL
jgi:SPX domain protein involved in polyphosphate accumulation